MLGGGRLPCLEDQPLLPYTNAVLHEVQRFITLLPHVPRCTATDTELGGYLLPKVRAHSSPARRGVGARLLGYLHCWGAVLQGTPVIPLLSSVLLDRTQWATPDRFNPSHFLDTHGRFVRRTAFLPFSAGARCALSPLPTQVGPRASAHLCLGFPTGRRVCVGESLARAELFLLFAGLLQRYHLRPTSLDMDPAPAFTMRPPAQALCAEPRGR